jgi:hypothetical protein
MLSSSYFVAGSQATLRVLSSSEESSAAIAYANSARRRNSGVWRFGGLGKGTRSASKWPGLRQGKTHKSGASRRAESVRSSSLSAQ